MTLIAYVFRNLQTVDNVVKQMSKKSPFRRLFDKQYGKRAQTLLKSAQQQLYHIYWWLWKHLKWKKSLLLIRKISGLFVNTLTADNKYSLFNKDNLTQLIQMQVSKK